MIAMRFAAGAAVGTSVTSSLDDSAVDRGRRDARPAVSWSGALLVVALEWST
jgi:hypothetical protein